MLPSSRRPRRSPVVAAVVVALLLGALPVSLSAAEAAGAATAISTPGTQVVHYRGVSVRVPSGWPVLRVAGRAGCVRFDRHAVYLGDPARDTCPTHLVGRTTAIHLTAGSMAGLTSPDRVIHPGNRAASRLSVHVSAAQDSAAVRAIAASVRFTHTWARVTRPGSSTHGPVSARGREHTFAAAPATRRTAVGPRDTTFTGLGFDACVAPSLTTMATWFVASPYKAANIYIGGASRSCAQPNLSPDWVAQTIAQGWTLIPTYVGLQAPCTNFPNRIDPAQPATQGAAAADDAVAQMDALGLRLGNPIYLDMEAFSTGNVACLAATQAFVDAWTVRLHERGYVSGVYSSVSSLKPLLVDRQGDPTFHQPDDLWFARWPAAGSPNPAGDPTLTDPLIPDQYWANHQRIHQYRGGHAEVWGGVTVTIDNNSVDAAVAPSSLAADGAFVQVAGVAAVFRIAGGAPVLVTDWAAVGGPQAAATLSASQFASFPDRPAEGTFLQSGTTGRVWRVVNGIATYVPDWTPYGGPQPSIVVDQAALDNAGTGGFYNLLTSGTPIPRTVGPVLPGTIASRESFTWFGGYSSSAVATYDVRWRAARWDGRFGAWTSPKNWQGTPVSDVPLGLRAGYTSCVSVRAHNRAGQVSGWTTQRCTARALDDRSLAASGGWTRKRSPAFFGGSALSSSRKGVSVTRSAARVRRVGVVVTTCAACGSLAVVVDGKTVGRLRLTSAVRHRHQVLMLPTIVPLGRHTVSVRSSTSGRLVQIDGLVLSRT